jgi:hypothetical protein
MIYEKISKFHNNMGKVTKDGKNPHFKSKYATIEGVLESIAEPLKQSGLSFTQIVDMDHVKTVISEIDGEDKIECKVPLILSKNDMQGLGSAITYARRYGLVAMLGIIQEDDDGNKACELDFNRINKLLEGRDVPKFLEYFKVSKVEQLNATQYQQALTMLMK